MGLRVLAVEPDAKMAAVAAAKGMSVEITSFEDWRPRPASFDLLACGQAWHWLDPAVRAPQAARCLKPGGGILLAWNLPVHPPEEEAALETVYHTALGPDREDVAAARQSPIDLPRFKAELVTSRFVTPEEDLVTWHRTYTAEEWCGLVGTQSGTLSMPPYRRARLLRLLHEYIERRPGGRLRVCYDYRIVSARLAV
jgi:SAM-dependent methyltransferase